MTKHFYNLSNHPSRHGAEGNFELKWKENQLRAAREIVEGRGHFFAGVEDVIHPEIDPTASTSEVSALAANVCAFIPDESDVMVMGETTFLLAAVICLKAKGCNVWVATTHRVFEESPNPDGSVRMTHVFQFVAFRQVP